MSEKDVRENTKVENTIPSTKPDDPTPNPRHNNPNVTIDPNYVPPNNYHEELNKGESHTTTKLVCNAVAYILSGLVYLLIFQSQLLNTSDHEVIYLGVFIVLTVVTGFIISPILTKFVISRFRSKG